MSSNKNSTRKGNTFEMIITNLPFQIARMHWDSSRPQLESEFRKFTHGWNP